MDMKERLMEFIREKDISNRKFLMKCGLSETYINTLTGNPSGDTIRKIENAYPELNTEWLMTGEGEMLKVQPAVKTPYPAEQTQSVGNISGNGNAVINGNGNHVATQGDVSAVEQPPIVPDAIVRRPDLDLIKWAESSEAEHAENVFDIAKILKKTRFIITTDDNSMSPTLFQNELVFCKPLPDTRPRDIIDGKCYVIDTRSRGAFIRQLFKQADGSILAVPINKQFGELVISEGDVLRIYHIIFHGSTRMSLLPASGADTHRREEQMERMLTLQESAMAEISRQNEEISRQNERMAEERRRQEQERKEQFARQDRLIEMLNEKK